LNQLRITPDMVFLGNRSPCILHTINQENGMKLSLFYATMPKLSFHLEAPGYLLAYLEEGRR
jgi:hypothetical protein